MAAGSPNAGAGVAAGAGAVVGALSFCCTALPPPLRPCCTKSQERVSAKTKKIPPSQRVIVWSTFVVCAPNKLSVMPPPNAAPRPSFFGRCMSTSRMISNETSTLMTSKILIKIDMRAANMRERCRGVKWKFARRD